MMIVSPPYRLSATLELHESDIKAVHAASNDLLITASRDTMVGVWERGREGMDILGAGVMSPGGTEAIREENREFALAHLLLGHHTYVNSVSYIPPSEEYPHGRVLSGNLYGEVLVHELGPAKVPEQGVGREPERRLQAHAQNVTSMCFSSAPSPPPPPPLAHQTTASPASSGESISSNTLSTKSSSSSAARVKPPLIRTQNLSAASATQASPSSIHSHSESQSIAQRRKSTDSFHSHISRASSRPNSSSSFIIPPPSPPKNRNVVMTTSWDCTAKVWDTDTWEQLCELEGHKEAVWTSVVIEDAPAFIPPSTVAFGPGKSNGMVGRGRRYLTGSADKVISLWSEDGTRLVNFKGSTDCVRGIVLLPHSPQSSSSSWGWSSSLPEASAFSSSFRTHNGHSTEYEETQRENTNRLFASCSNDGNVHIWNFMGEMISILKGHSSFVYSLCLIKRKGGGGGIEDSEEGGDAQEDGFDLASCGEDHSVRIWRDGNLVQTLLLPTISVWCVAALPNGDIVTGSSDCFGRIFTRDRRRFADTDNLKAYEETVAEVMKSPFSRPTATTDNVALRPTYFSRRVPSFRISVDVADDAPPIELVFDPSKDDIDSVSQKFVEVNNLPIGYVERIGGFLKEQMRLRDGGGTTPGVEILFHGEGILDGVNVVERATFPRQQNSLLGSEFVQDPENLSFNPGDEDEDFSDEKSIRSVQASIRSGRSIIPSPLQLLQQAEMQKLQENLDESGTASPVPRSLEGIAKRIRDGKIRNIVIMAGAGISTSAGIPDFRTKGTGLYDNLQKYNLPNPQAIFEINFFKENPKPFYELAKALYPGKFFPTTAHYFFRLLEKRGLLRRLFTQNIDCLERISGVSPEKLVEAHGSFAASRCIICKAAVDPDVIKSKIMNGTIPYCEEKHCQTNKKALVKPDIVFFGEGLPEKFFECMPDLALADLLIVLGTSLKVQPFASLIDRVPSSTPRLLINREEVGSSSGSVFQDGFHFHDPNGRDVLCLGDSDSGVRDLCRLIGADWEEELEALAKAGRAELEEEWGKEAPTTNQQQEEEYHKTLVNLAKTKI